MSDEIAPDAAQDEIEDAVAERGARIMLIAVALLIIGAVITLTLVYWEDDVEKVETVFDAEAPVAPETVAAEVPVIAFRDATAELGIEFRHDNGADGRKLLPETMGAGAAFIDFDRDGDPDLFLVNGRPWKSGGESPLPTQAFYENRDGRFVDVTEEVGFDFTCYGMGAAVGDFDSDGFPDLFVTTVGKNRLLRNVDGERFVDVTEAAGVGRGERWSTSAAWLDIDGDRKLDLFVLNYVVWSPEIDLAQGFKLVGLGRAYGPPTGFQGETCQLFRNLGGGRFEDVTATSGVAVKNPATGAPMAKALGVAVCDFNRDSRPDLIVSNDTVENFAFENLGGGRFKEVGSELGIDRDNNGNARGAMGISVGDHRNDGSRAVAIGNFANEMTAFYVNERPGDPDSTFYDEATSVGLGAPTRSSLTFGLRFFDYDLDGRIDLATANGHVEPDINVVQSSQKHAQAVELFWNSGPEGGGRFLKVSRREAGEDLFHPVVGRGLATADVDSDGDLDLLVTCNDGKARLFINEVQGRHSLRLDLRRRDGRSLATGSTVTVETGLGVQYRYTGASGSYLSSSESTLTFGLGSDQISGRVRIIWPDRTETIIEKLAAGRHKIVQGTD